MAEIYDDGSDVNFDNYDESEDCPAHGGIECEPEECGCHCNYCEGFKNEIGEEDEDDVDA